MFTGIVTHRGRIDSLEPTGSESDLLRLRLRPEPPWDGPAIGDSVAVDGVCLTVVARAEGDLAFDAIPETLRRTTLGRRVVGDLVNLEGALRLGDPLGGHWVQGHVDGVGQIVEVTRRSEDVRMVLEVSDELYAGMLQKAGVALDGVSLTVGEVWREGGSGRFCVYLIPHTLEVTGLGAKGPGDPLNVEADILGRWVEHHVRRMRGEDAPSPA